MVGERMSSARKSMVGRFGVKITQEDAARMLGVSISTYRSWEQCKTEPDASMLGKLAVMYKVSADSLLELPAFDSVSADESKLVGIYRKCSETGKAAIIASAHGIAYSFGENDD